MKMRSFSTLACVFAVGAMFASTGLFAHRISFSDRNPDLKERCRHCFDHKVVEQKKDKVVEDWHIIVGSESTIFAAQGTAANPNPSTNDSLDGTIVSNRVVINAAVAGYIAVLESLGVRAPVLVQIKDANDAWVDGALLYSLVMNLHNVGLATDAEQDAAAEAFVQSGVAYGALLSAVAGDARIANDIAVITNYQTQLAQADRGVLNDSNVWNAEPSDPASESTAATAIDSAIHMLAKEVGTLLVFGINHEQCRACGHRR